MKWPVRICLAALWILGSSAPRLLAVASSETAAAMRQSIQRVSVGVGGTEADDYSWHSSISADGKVVAFQSNATNLTAGDSNAVHDIYLRDLAAGTTDLISVNQAGFAGNGISDFPAISASAGRVAFLSEASDLISADGNAYADIFVRDRQLQQTIRVSLSSAGSEANGPSYSPAISANGRFVAFVSLSDNLVPADVNGSADVFVHDLQNQETRLVSVGVGGAPANGASFTPSISGDGRYLAFRSAANNLTANDNNGQHDIFLHDLFLGTTEIVSLTATGLPANHRSDYPSLSADGTRVAFRSTATNLVPGDTNQINDIFVRDRRLQTTRRVNVRNNGQQANAESFDPAISADGRYVVFRSGASNLVRGDSNQLYDVFCHDLSSSLTERISVGGHQQQGNGESWYPSISADGTAIAFKSYSTNLGVPDLNQHSDIYLRRRARTEITP
ncbi:MAG: PD40 domain-containing protein [Planctomycetes bacterium]|nr:PD40 domain-containing protein [Planctomycetota bacterium]